MTPSSSLLSASGPSRKCPRSWTASPVRFTKASKQCVSSQLSFSDTEDDSDDDDASSVLSSCGSSASDQSLLSCAASQPSSPARAEADEYSSGNPIGRRQRPSTSFTHPGSDARRGDGNEEGMGELPCAEEMWLKGLVELKVPITHDLDEALRSNGKLAYVPPSAKNTTFLAACASSISNPGVHLQQAQEVSAPTVPQPAPYLHTASPDCSQGHLQLPPSPAFAPQLPPLPKLTGCSCHMCLPPPGSPVSAQSSLLPGLAPPGTVLAAMPQPEACKAPASVPSSLAIAAALASGQVPYMGGWERPALLDMQQAAWAAPIQAAAQVQSPASYTAALLMARTGALLPPSANAAMHSQQPLLGRPLALPIGAPTLVEPGAVWR